MTRHLLLGFGQCLTREIPRRCGLALGPALSSCLGYSIFRAQQDITGSSRSGADGHFRNAIPYLEPDGKFGAVVGDHHPRSTALFIQWFPENLVAAFPSRSDWINTR